MAQCPAQPSPAQPSPASSRLVVMRMTPIELSGTELRLSTNKLDRALNNCNSLTVIGNRFPGARTRELQRSGLVTREHCVHNNNHPPRPAPGPAGAGAGAGEPLL